MNMSSFLGAVSSAAELEPGDRFEVAPIGSTDRLSLPKVLGPDGFAIEQIEDLSGRPLDSALDPAGEFARRAEAGRGRLPVPPRRSGWSIARRAGSG